MSEEYTNAQIEMKANSLRLHKDGEEVFSMGLEEHEGNRLGISLALPVPPDVPDDDAWLTFRFDFVSLVALTSWLGHAVRVVEGTVSDEEIAEAQRFMDDLNANSQAPQNRQQRRAAERRARKEK